MRRRMWIAESSHSQETHPILVPSLTDTHPNSPDVSEEAASTAWRTGRTDASSNRTSGAKRDNITFGYAVTQDMTRSG